MKESIFLQAFEGTNKQIPVWFMRQAGRFLPEYRKLKEKYSLNKMFRTPELAAQITCMPIATLNVDAAILYADILTLPSRMGFKIKFLDKQGPVIQNLLSSPADVERIHDFDNLDHVSDTIQLVNQQLPPHIPLIGFAGSPFSVLTYLVEGGSSIHFKRVLDFAIGHDAAFHKLMKKLTKNTIDYLHMQKDAGIKAFQIFDTWAGILRPADYGRWVLPYLREIFENVDLPSIYYLKNCHHLLALMDECKADFLSVCHTVVLAHNPILRKTKKGIQGNLYNHMLFADEKTLMREVNDVLEGAKYFPRYIFNLSHGILPETPVDKVRLVVEKVHEYAWKT